ncbi:DUF1524 domain-containing protein [Gordonia jinghuaiqii]|uniref:DUF1524 domain-containing protein n=1 Tax=Gordonia jinghuaiqii TaxID=2758710 RepID=A0A7D7LUT0_9ACTN|nr:DUF1524 domain-containing protein [Gordonia jinghuaiqii]MCR5978458.1 DUF1524 domain-containing protein [Gordonia jinghuaiqii]QMT02797.1 DUF1524 domain-containing protein [Gordonia jinghuaiqii]
MPSTCFPRDPSRADGGPAARRRTAPSTRWLLTACGVAAFALAVGGCGVPQPTAGPSTTETTMTATSTADEALPAPSPAVTVVAAPAADSALRKLNSLAVKGRAPKTGYDRALFGQAWSDDVGVEGGRNGCDTRNDILRRDLTDIAVKAGSHGCAVLSGSLADPYTGTTIRFVRGQSTSSAVQIDHVVALSDAWQKGAQQLSAAQRADFANDPRNLQAVDGPTNQQKGAGDAATWLPPNKSYRCTYVSRQVEVKAAYKLWVTQAEKASITSVLTGCGASGPSTGSPSGQTRTSTATPSPPRTRTPAPAPTPTPTYTPPPAYAPPAEGPSSAYFANCSAARAAGAAPLYAGQPGYRAKLDRDGDGVACE